MRITAPAIALLVLGASVSATAQVQKFETRSFVICKGEQKSQCKSHDYFIGCKESETPLIESVCTVNVGGGGKRVREYTKEEISSDSGNQCGYTRWRAQCAAE